MEPEIPLTIGSIITGIIILVKVFGKPVAALFSKIVNSAGGKISEQQDVRDDRQKNIEWLRTQLLEEENNNKKEIHAYKEEIASLTKQIRELNISLSQAQSNLIISEAEKKVLEITIDDLKNKIDRLKIRLSNAGDNDDE